MQSPRAPRSGTLAWGARGVCAIGPSPAIPSGLGHKYVSLGAGGGAVSLRSGMTTRAVLPKASLSQASRGSEWQACVGARYRWGCLLPKALVRSTGRGGNHPTQPQLPRILRAARYSGHQVPGCPLPRSVGPSPLGGCLVRHLHLSLSS